MFSLPLLGTTMVMLVVPLGGQLNSKAGQSASRPVRFGYSRSPFVGLVPFHFQGNDLEKIAAGLVASLKDRGEFETTSQYEARILAAQNAPLPGGLAPNSSLAFVFPTDERLQTDPLGKFALAYAYDADSQILKVAVEAGPTPQKLRKDPTELALKWVVRTKSGAAYQATNRFGAVVRVSRRDYTDYAVSVHAEPNMFGLYAPGIPGQPITVSFKISPDKAQNLKGRLRLLLVCTIVQAAPVSQEQKFDRATIDIPLESTTTTTYLHVKPSAFWIFDSITGEVVAKARPSGIVLEDTASAESSD